MENENIIWASLIKNGRIAKGYSRYGLAIEAGVSQTAIRSIENGKCKGKTQISTLSKICTALGIEWNDALNKLGYVISEESLGTFIESNRIYKGHSIQDLANLCDLSYVTLYNIEHNKCIPHLSTFRTICSVLNIDFAKANELRKKSSQFSNLSKQDMSN